MQIQTTRFGMVEIDETRILHFPDGLLGFEPYKRYALIQTSDDPVFFWLQSVDEPSLAFVVCDPRAFVPDYQVPVRQADLDALGIGDLDEAQVLVIVNKVGESLTGNLLGPLVIGARSLRGRQLVLSDRRYSTRHPLWRLEPKTAVSKSA